MSSCTFFRHSRQFFLSRLDVSNKPLSAAPGADWMAVLCHTHADTPRLIEYVRFCAEIVRLARSKTKHPRLDQQLFAFVLCSCSVCFSSSTIRASNGRTSHLSPPSRFFGQIAGCCWRVSLPASPCCLARARCALVSVPLGWQWFRAHRCRLTQGKMFRVPE